MAIRKGITSKLLYTQFNLAETKLKDIIHCMLLYQNCFVASTSARVEGQAREGMSAPATHLQIGMVRLVEDYIFHM